jgi:hypothetical protein
MSIQAMGYPSKQLARPPQNSTKNPFFHSPWLARAFENFYTLMKILIRFSSMI